MSKAENTSIYTILFMHKPAKRRTRAEVSIPLCKWNSNNFAQPTRGLIILERELLQMLCYSAVIKCNTIYISPLLLVPSHLSHYKTLKSSPVLYRSKVQHIYLYIVMCICQLLPPNDIPSPSCFDVCNICVFTFLSNICSLL